MKKNNVHLSTESIEKYTNSAKDNLSYYIARKKEYRMNANLYNNNLNIVNKDLAYTLTRIEELINEIRELSKRISLLEKTKVSLAYNHNLLLGNKDKNNINKINAYRYYYNEIIDKLNNLTRRRDELKDMLKWYKKKITVLVLRKKHFSKYSNKCMKNVDICNYNMNACYKVLDRIDNIYLNKSNKVAEKYIVPKVKKNK